MEKIEEFLAVSYEKIVVYLTEVWLNTIKSWHSIDFIMLGKVTFVILLGYFLATILSKHIPNGIKILAKKVNFSVDKDLILAIRGFIFKLIFFLFLLIAIGMLNLSDGLASMASAIVKSIIVLSFVGFALTVSKLLLNKMANTPIDNAEEESVRVVKPATLPLFENTALILFYVVGLYQVFAIWNVDMTALLAGAGIGAMAVGMAAKDTLSDIIAGILILTDSPYKVGDVVYVSGNLKGRVSAIGLRNTRLVTKNNVEIIVPNTIMGTSQIVNESSSKAEGIRIHMDVAAAFGEDINRVKSLLIEAANVSRRIAQDKEIKAMMIGFEMDMLRFRIQCWINDPEDKGSAKGELMENVYLKFREEHIDITMTKYQHVKNSYEGAQELHITQFPDTRQAHFVKEFPDTKQDINIKEMPNLFGAGSPKVLTKVSKNSLKKDDDEK
ncbi:MAG: mechanosensitive ion channel family protein [Sulfurovaceae bacterium]|nr:mechanosensitive ion channel family protein [Sulfurovaceae bacterium]